MEAKRDSTGRAQLPDSSWSRCDELNWAADRTVMRSLKKRGEEPSEWLAREYRELSGRRKAAGAAKVAPRG